MNGFEVCIPVIFLAIIITMFALEERSGRGKR